MTKARDLANASTALSAVSATELAFVDGVTSAIQTQIDAKAPSSTAVTLTGTQTLTNKTLTSPVIASVVNNTLTSTTGDMIYASAANTPARLGIGSSAQVLTVAGGIPSWATASSGGMTLLSTTSLTGSSVTVSSISQSYINLYLVVEDMYTSVNESEVTFRFNADATANRHQAIQTMSNAASVGFAGNKFRWFYGISNNASYKQMGIMIIPNYANTTNLKFGQCSTTGFNAYNLAEGVNNDFVGAYNQAVAISSFSIFPDTGNFSGGTVKVYGVK